jgi:RimJ/RimL family protein N-acetyltransferase
MNSEATYRVHGGGKPPLLSHHPQLTVHPSLYGASKTPEDTEKALQNILPVSHLEGEEKVHRFPYAVHEIAGNDGSNEEQFIGLITLRTLSASETKFPPRDKHGSTSTSLSLELAYMFLPQFWGRGYATESIAAILEKCACVPAAHWTPYDKVVVRAIVNDENAASQKVMEKCDMEEPEVVEFEGGRFFIAGKWRTRHRLFVYGREIVAGLE